MPSNDMELTRPQLSGRYSTGGVTSMTSSLSGDPSFMGRHGCSARRTVSASSVSTESSSKGRSVTPTEINVQLGIRWDADRVSLDGSMLDRRKSQNSPTRPNSGPPASNPSPNEPKPNFQGSQKSSPPTKRKISVTEYPDQKTMGRSRLEAHKFQDLERGIVPEVKLHPRSPTTKDDRSTYDVISDKRPVHCRPSDLRLANELYTGNLMTEVVKNVFIGKIEAAYSEQLLCKLGIECIIDLTDLLPNQVPGKVKSLCPCTCALQTPHSRAKLRIGIENKDGAQMSPYVEDAVRFIKSACNLSRPVLVHSYSGKSRAPSIILHYLMLEESMSLSSAFEKLSERWNNGRIVIHPSFISELVRLDSTLFPGQKNSFGLFSNDIVGPQSRHTDSYISVPATTSVRKASIKAWH